MCALRSSLIPAFRARRWRSSTCRPPHRYRFVSIGFGWSHFSAIWMQKAKHTLQTLCAVRCVETFAAAVEKLIIRRHTNAKFKKWYQIKHQSTIVRNESRQPTQTFRCYQNSPHTSHWLQQATQTIANSPAAQTSTAPSLNKCNRVIAWFDVWRNQLYRCEWAQRDRSQRAQWTIDDANWVITHLFEFWCCTVKSLSTWASQFVRYGASRSKISVTLNTAFVLCARTKQRVSVAHDERNQRERERADRRCQVWRLATTDADSAQCQRCAATLELVCRHATLISMLLENEYTKNTKNAPGFVFANNCAKIMISRS